MVVGARRIRNKKLWELQYREGYARSLEGKGVEWVGNAWTRELCRVKKGLDERIDEDMFQWFGHLERMEKDRITKIVYVGECAASCSLGRLWKRWIDIMKEC